MGSAYANSEKVIQNYQATNVWFNIASANGDAKAKQGREITEISLSPNALLEAQRLAKQCLESEYEDCSVHVDPYRLAQEQAEAEAEGRRLAQLSPLDRGLEAYRVLNYAIAFRELRPLAELGNAYVQFYLGLMYELGRGIATDNAKAIGWYQKAAAQGHGGAKTSLRGLQ